MQLEYFSCSHHRNSLAVDTKFLTQALIIALVYQSMSTGETPKDPII